MKRKLAREYGMCVHGVCAYIDMAFCFKQMSKPISLQANCGYGRYGMRKLTLTAFKDLFMTTPNYGLSDSYFMKNSSRPSTFERHCNKVKAVWAKKWYPFESRVTYETTFSAEKWKGLPSEERKLHSLSECRACYKMHKGLYTNVVSTHSSLHRARASSDC